MGIASYLGFGPAEQTGAHADTEKKTTRRLVVTAATGTAATAAAMALMWGTMATPAAASDGVTMPSDGVGYEGPSMNLTPNKGTGGLNLYDRRGNLIGMMSEADIAGIQGCHPSDPTKAWVVQLTHGHQSGEGSRFPDGWGASAGYVHFPYGHVTEAGVPVPCGG